MDTLAGLPPRYSPLNRIAVGGMGEVWRVRDELLRGTVVMKVCLATIASRPALRQRFLDEARLTAQLHHPAIIAVHDLGALPDGRPFFTMEEVRGRTVEEVIRERALGAPGAWTLRRLVDSFLRAAQAIAYAHQQGVLHRDLKPENLMVGDFGEVRVMDWGLARRAVDADAPSELDLGPREGGGTMMGEVMGTPAYMSPEQASGRPDRIGLPTDIYALGAVLYAVLSGAPPYAGTAQETLRALRQGPPQPLDRALPGPLRAICERAMARDPFDRHVDAQHLVDEVAAWLDDTEREREAMEIVAQAQALAPTVAELRARARAVAAAADEAAAGVQPHDPIAAKLPAWRLEATAAELRREARLVEIEYVQTLRAALSRHPGLVAADALLARHYREQLEAAEARRDPAAADEAEALLRAHARGHHLAWLDGDGALTLVTEPAATAELFRYVEEDRRLVPRHERTLGPTPLRDVPIARGSWLVELHAPGRPVVRYPVLIERGQRWDGVPPGGAAPAPIVLPPALDADEVYVPAGWAWTGGDAEAADGLPLRRWWIDGFVLRRDPVTNADYIAFLNELVGLGQEEEAIARAPGEPGAPSCYTRDRHGRFVPGADRHGRSWAPDTPVVLVSWADATAYASWRAAREGVPWRLPHDLEWEKAARGVDRRLQPWGDHLDATWANVGTSRAGPPAWAPVSAFSADESPYGVRGMAGNVRDWCANRYRRAGPPEGSERLQIEEAPPEPGEITLRVMRGGAWSSAPRVCRLVGRFANRADERFVPVGFRLARSL